MTIAIGVIIGILLFKFKDKVAEICVKIVDKIKGLFAKK